MQDDELYGNGIAKKHFRDLWNGDLRIPEGGEGPIQERLHNPRWSIAKAREEQKKQARSSVG